MDRSTTKQALEILEAVLGLEHHEHSEYIDRACGANEELKQEVLAQLDYHHEATITATSLESLPMPELPVARDFAARYELGEEIAHGGVGRIFRARDRELGRVVAIKVLRDEHKKRADVVRRFVTEAQISGRLTHPGITPVHEIGVLPEGDPFIAMKLVDGQTLASLLKQRPGTNEDLPHLIGIFERICQTVAFAHSRGVVHRDLKPDNVMVSSYGEVQVMDWGLAKQFAEECDEPGSWSKEEGNAPGRAAQ